MDLKRIIDKEYANGWSNFTINNPTVLDLSTLYLRASVKQRPFLRPFVLSNLDNLTRVIFEIPRFDKNKVGFLGSTYEIKKVRSLHTVKGIDVSFITFDKEPKGYILLKDKVAISFTYAEHKRELKQLKEVLKERAHTLLQKEAINYFVNLLISKQL